MQILFAFYSLIRKLTENYAGVVTTEAERVAQAGTYHTLLSLVEGEI